MINKPLSQDELKWLKYNMDALMKGRIVQYEEMARGNGLTAPLYESLLAIREEMNKLQIK